MTHPALTQSSDAVVTGRASGIGLAAATPFAEMGLTFVIDNKSIAWAVGDIIENALRTQPAASRLRGSV